MVYKVQHRNFYITNPHGSHLWQIPLTSVFEKYGFMSKYIDDRDHKGLNVFKHYDVLSAAHNTKK